MPRKIAEDSNDSAKKAWKTPVLKRDSVQSETRAGFSEGAIITENSFYNDS